MECIAKSAHPEKQRSSCIIVGLFTNKKVSAPAAKVDSVSKGFISNIIKKGDFTGKLGEVLMLYGVNNISSDRVLLVGCGDEKSFSLRNYINACQAAAKHLIDKSIQEAISFLPLCDVKTADMHWKIRQAYIATASANYNFTAFKSKKQKHPNINKFTLAINTRRQLLQAESAIKEGAAIVAGMSLMKDLANTPPNTCTPAYLAKEANKLAKSSKKVSTVALGQKELESLGLNALLSVGKGSHNSPKLITIEYRGTKANAKPIVFVGKGITFDTGGNSMKPGPNMVGMKFDMSGAAAAVGLIKFAAELELPINIVSVLAAAENMVDGKSYRPEDVIKTLSGKTVEVLNTDAEGRLALCDALTYSERFNPDIVIDLATLTGACIVALGHHHSGVFSNNDALAQDIIAAGLLAEDKAWRLPITEEYHEQLKSHVADFANIGGPAAGAITAGCFLSKFAEKFTWAHIDIAGTASNHIGKQQLSTGRPIPMLAQFLINRANAK